MAKKTPSANVGLPQIYNEVARRADTEGLQINVVETKRVLACFFDVLEDHGGRQLVFRLSAMASNSALRGCQYFRAVHRFPQYRTPRITQAIPTPLPSSQNNVSGSCKPTTITI